MYHFTATSFFSCQWVSIFYKVVIFFHWFHPFDTVSKLSLWITTNCGQIVSIQPNATHTTQHNSHNSISSFTCFNPSILCPGRVLLGKVPTLCFSLFLHIFLLVCMFVCLAVDCCLLLIVCLFVGLFGWVAVFLVLAVIVCWLLLIYFPLFLFVCCFLLL